MQFKNPDLLFALFLLVIPILIHLFQLRKFKKEPFTNLKFLKKISIQTRKSSKIKQWLVLLTRLLALSALIIAFAQPFMVNSLEALKQNEVVVYLDNSYSMQAKGTKGRLLQRNIQDLLEKVPPTEEFTLFTNNNTYKNITTGTARTELQQIDYSIQEMDFPSVALKAASEFSNSEKTKKIFVAISDYQENKGFFDPNNSSFQFNLVKTQPQNKTNISVDSAFVENTAGENVLFVQLSATGTFEGNLPVSVFNKEKLMAKNSVSFSAKKRATAKFSLPNNTEIQGKVSIEDAHLIFDNQLFFSIAEPEPINVVAISEVDNNFLNRIFSTPDFSFVAYKPKEVDYANLTSANVVVLNQVDEISASLAGNLENLLKNDATLLIIPAQTINLNSYNSFFRLQDVGFFSELEKQEKMITGISFSHPIFQDVFNEEVKNFEYPKVQSYFKTNTAAAKVLAFEDNSPFLLQKDKIYIFTAALDAENSNFKNSPLIVPTLFNIGKTALKNKQLYYILGNENTADVAISTGKDEILRLANEKTSFIPQQQSFANKVSFTLNDLPEQPGNFSILKKDEIVGQMSFNISRKESSMKFSNLENSNNISVSTSVSDVFDDIKAENNIDELWKWFVIFALIFLLAEMLILKFLK